MSDFSRDQILLINKTVEAAMSSVEAKLPAIIAQAISTHKDECDRVTWKDVAAALIGTGVIGVIIGFAVRGFIK